MLPYREGGGLPAVGGGGSLMTHSAGSVLNHTGTPDILNRSWQVCHTLRFAFLKHFEFDLNFP